MLNHDINNFRIAEFGIRIIFEKKSENSMMTTYVPYPKSSVSVLETLTLGTELPLLTSLTMVDINISLKTLMALSVVY